jgi:hypothetical protein
VDEIGGLADPDGAGDRIRGTRPRGHRRSAGNEREKTREDERKFQAPEVAAPDEEPLGDGGGAEGPLQPGVVADDETEGKG